MMNFSSARVMPGYQGFAEDNLAVKLTDGRIRLGRQTQVIVGDAAAFQAGFHQTFGQRVDGCVFGGGAVLQTLDQFFSGNAGSAGSAWDLLFAP